MGTASAASSAVGAAGDFLVLVQRAPDNSWQTSAQSTFLDAFASDFSLTRTECASKNFELEPSLTKLCMMEESEDPYKNSYDPNTAAYGRVMCRRAAEATCWLGSWSTKLPRAAAMLSIRRLCH